jgi:hypothetical protein
VEKVKDACVADMEATLKAQEGVTFWKYVAAPPDDFNLNLLVQYKLKLCVL